MNFVATGLKDEVLSSRGFTECKHESFSSNTIIIQSLADFVKQQPHISFEGAPMLTAKFRWKQSSS